MEIYISVTCLNANKIDLSGMSIWVDLFQRLHVDNFRQN